MPCPWQRVCCHASLPDLMGEIATRLSGRTLSCFLREAARYVARLNLLCKFVYAMQVCG